MSQEMPPESQEPTPEREMSPEEFQEMIAQIPALEEMVRERQERIHELGESGDPSEIARLNQEIAELSEEISARKELVGVDEAGSNNI